MSYKQAYACRVQNQRAPHCPRGAPGQLKMTLGVIDRSA